MVMHKLGVPLTFIRLGLKKKALGILQGLTEHRRDAACCRGARMSEDLYNRSLIRAKLQRLHNPSGQCLGKSLPAEGTRLHSHTAPHPTPANSNEGTWP